MNDITHYKECLLGAIIKEVAKEVNRINNKKLTKKLILVESEGLTKAFIAHWIIKGVVTVIKQAKKDGITCNFIGELYKTGELFFEKIDLDVLYKAIKQDMLYKKAKRKGITIDIGGNKIKDIISSVLETEKVL
jgi:hypothetical protein